MKILVFNNGYITDGLSGGDKHVIDVAEVWSKDHEVSFMLPDFAAGRIIDRIKTIKYSSFQPRSLPGLLCAYLVRLLRALKVSKRTPADIVVCSVGLFDLIPAVLHKKRYGSKAAVYAFHIVPKRKGRGLVQSIQFKLSRFAQWLSISWFRKCDVVFACNEFVKEGLVEMGVPAEQVVVTRLAVNVQGVQDAEPIRKCQALFIGRIVVSKGVYDLIEAVKDLDVNVGLVGDGTETDSIQSLIKEYGMEDRIELLGYLPDDRPPLYSYLKGCDFFLFPSHEEGYGIVIAEAIIAGKPVVTYELPHYREAFGEGLITCKVGDVEGLRENIRKLISGEIDTERIVDGYKDLRILNAEQSGSFDLESIVNSGC